MFTGCFSVLWNFVANYLQHYIFFMKFYLIMQICPCLIDSKKKLYNGVYYIFQWNIITLSPRFKKFKKIRLGSSVVEPYLRLGLSDLSCSNFQQILVHKTGLMLYFADFHGWNWCIPGFDENKTQHWALFFTKTNQGRFYFHWA